VRKRTKGSRTRSWPEIDRIRVVGKKQPVRIFEPVGEFGSASSEEADAVLKFQRGLELFRGREWDGAIQVFGTFPDDAVARLYLDRCRAFRQDPPPPEWDGVVDLKTK